MGRYLYCQDPHSGRLRREHIVVWENVTGKKLPKGYVIHHIDGNGKNNDFSNLQLMTRAEHNSLHAKLKREGKDVIDASDPDVIEDRRQSKEEWKRSYPRRRLSEIERTRKFREEHPEEARKSSHDAYYKNRDRELERRRINHEANKERDNEMCRQYRKAHRDELIAYSRDYYQKNKDILRERYREKALAYQHENRDLINARHMLAYAKKHGFPEDELKRRQDLVDQLTKRKENSDDSLV